MGDIRDSLTGSTGFILDESSSGTSLVQIIKASDVDISEFHEYRQYLPDQHSIQSVPLSKNAPLISTPEELQAFDDYLQENEDKVQLFVSKVCLTL